MPRTMWTPNAASPWPASRRPNFRTTAVLALALVALAPVIAAPAAGAETYAERLGFPAGSRVVLIHVDDAGMSHDSNRGAIRALTEGVATSMSVMMPCPWVPELAHRLREHPTLDVGLHLTLTSEWEEYRWGPLAGKPAVPGLVDPEGALWPTVAEVVAHATADEVEREIRAQIERARALGIEITHLDSHMGTLFASDAFLERYLKIGAELRIPVMFPGGHNTALEQQYRDDTIAELRRAGSYREGMEVPEPAVLQRAPTVGKLVWELGLPVLDDLHNTSYGWRLAPGVPVTDDALREHKVERYRDALRALHPGLTMMILHATDTSDTFPAISDSGPTRRGDLLAMLDPRLRQTIQQEGIVQTTWRELMARRAKVAP